MEDDIEFLVANKRAKVCEDDSSEDRSSPDIMEQIKDIKLDSDEEKGKRIQKMIDAAQDSQIDENKTAIEILKKSRGKK